MNSSAASSFESAPVAAAVGTPEKVRRLAACLEAGAPLLIAYSGGVDSAYLLAMAHRRLGGRMLGVIADSPSLPRRALAEALELAQSIAAPVEVVRTEEMHDANYTSNPLNRCYYCKAELFTRLDELARARGFAAIAYGENADDATHHRPGGRAAAEFAVLAPLKEAGLTKAEIRALSRELGLPTADAPAQPCLSSRIQHGTPVTPEALAMVERGEALVRELGFRVFRVRYLSPENGRHRARVQVAPEEMGKLASVEAPLVEGLLEAGFGSVEIDPAGYRSPA